MPYLTNETILNLTELPEHLLVLGGGYVGLEIRTDVQAVREQSDGDSPRSAHSAKRRRRYYIGITEVPGSRRCSLFTECPHHAGSYAARADCGDDGGRKRRTDAGRFAPAGGNRPNTPDERSGSAKCRGEDGRKGLHHRQRAAGDYRRGHLGDWRREGAAQLSRMFLTTIFRLSTATFTKAKTYLRRTV